MSTKIRFIINTYQNSKWFLLFGSLSILILTAAACSDTDIISTDELDTISVIESKSPNSPASNEGPYSDFSAVAFDIDAVSDGSILVTYNNVIKEIRKNKVNTVTTLPTANGSPITGISDIGRGNFFAISGRVFSNDQEAILWRVSRGEARKISDIQAFEEAQDPDAQIYDPRCNNVFPFVAGPQSDPYHITTLNGREVLIADAAGNTLLSAKTDGSIDWVALFPPAVDDQGNIPTVPITLNNGEVISCKAQPVPTSVAVGPDGAYYVGELTGTPAQPGWSRIWRVESDAMNTVCPSDDCTLAVTGLTSIIDLTFGPDGMLYVAEYDKNSWLSLFGGTPAGGAIKKCDVSNIPTSSNKGCVIVEEAGIYPDLPLPSALTFDKWGNLWSLLDNLGTIGNPTVRKISLP
ncbi:ScyD/ScyE family protein [Fodinibius sp.]|uniref:ScyD/ScyE family protein n=1 Tax=Fodinibius sp. TaxID=1872440 RepID=UPI002ACD923D|nr:ScyD/ScyE family protein [Fodinibius sp.]MDZ7659118.1 ScyD/ScyE family protein [Fodinibius sp.]